MLDLPRLVTAAVLVAYLVKYMCDCSNAKSLRTASELESKYILESVVGVD